MPERTKERGRPLEKRFPPRIDTAAEDIMTGDSSDVSDSSHLLLHS